ncbi:MAG: RNA polymerase-associated protein RapA [Methylococcaceae bacterium]|nr:RNA polymerase-associated protein RapA [Methylococcaceae bacterium]
MTDFIAGQRWISSTEPELGLGLILESLANRVTVLFLATADKRVYATNNAPLTRVKFAVGDEIESTEPLKFTVKSLSEQQGLVTYQGVDEYGDSVTVDEIDLNHHLQFNKPQERLFTGQTDPSSWFLLRYETWRKLQKQQQSPIKGLQGGRTSLIAHQLFIAQHAANRFSPKIMLADEVGLGKTIEAGLILHHRLLNGLSQRALIIVPEPLLHQWLVEMLRRFNLRFSLFNEARCEESGDDNPFVSEQLILAGQQFFADNPKRQQQALDAGWDMLIVDEAHHLEWSEHQPSPEYLFVEQLSHSTQGVILLTATPEQLGKESHFARLRLLDPDRFYSFAAFLEEEQQFEPVAEIAQLLLAGEPLGGVAEANLKKLVKDDNVDSLLSNLNDSEQAEKAREQLINILLDHHGTGRILFRNSRQTVKGFPEREAYAYPLKGATNADELADDVHVHWLLEKLKELDSQQAVLICHHAQTVMDLEKLLKKCGLSVAVFHEKMSIIERDRAAAYFADPDNAAQILLCSEIGSEGRNFQFAHHLILFDLPTNPDLLQQRIGRLDRIGQTSIIQIHIPYVANSPQQVLYHWYHDGLDAFHHNCSGAQAVAMRLGDELEVVMQSQDNAVIDAFILKTQTVAAEIEAEMHKGRDQLLELNSCRPQEAQALIELLEQEEQQDLWTYAEELFDCYGVDTEEHSKDCYIVRPSETLRISHFPYLSEDGLTLTVNRETALAREDMQFLTLEHPMMVAAMDLVLSSDTGNASMSVVKHPELKGGQFLLELLFIVECAAPADLQIGRFLPATPIRILINQKQEDVSEDIVHEELLETHDKLNKEQIGHFLNSQRVLVQQMLALAEEQARAQMEMLITDSNVIMVSSLRDEIKRLQRLKKINPSIKEEEVEQLKDVAMLLHENINEAQLKLDAVRFIVTK